MAVKSSWNIVSKDHPVFRLVEHQAHRQPGATAAVLGVDSLTYHELNNKANQLARYLRSRGVERGSHVCVFLPPSLDVLCCLLAIHKAGAVYVPLEPLHPRARIKDMLADILPVVVLTYSAQRGLLAGLVDAIIALDAADLRAAVTQQPVANLDVDVALEEAAYIFFTSGTTGRPKGVVATQANLLQYIGSAVETFSMGPGVIMPTIARLTFSISLFELLCPLACGGVVRLLVRDDILNLDQLVDNLRQVTMFHMGPSLLKRLVAYLEERPLIANELVAIQHVSSGGDLVRPELLARVRALFLKAEIFVIYGCSEVACMGCFYPLPPRAIPEKCLVGKVFANVVLRLMEPSGRPVPQGGIGEICIGGLGVSRGYLNRPELNDKKYLLLDGQRFYRTGDLGRIAECGNLEMLGRQDFQVKINGIRVELGEIEAHLLRVAGLLDAVVVARKLGDQDESTLVAYVVLDRDNPPTVERIRRFLQGHLADYMMPAIFVRLDELPVNHNLKLDRHSLPMPTADNILLSSERVVEPRTDVERQMMLIWRNALKLSDFGIWHNFFELGGNSLIALHILAEIEKHYAKRVSIAAFLEAPTIAGLAALVTQAPAVSEERDWLFIKRGNGENPLFCLQGVMKYKALAECLDDHQTVVGIYPSEEVGHLLAGDWAALERLYVSVESLAQRYKSVLRSLQPSGPYNLCGLSFGGVLAIEVARLLKEEGQETNLLALLDCWEPNFHHRSHWRLLARHLANFRTEGFGYFAKRAERLLFRLRLSRSKIAELDTPRREEYLEQVRKRARDFAVKQYRCRPLEQDVLLIKARQRTPFEPPAEALGWEKVFPHLTVHSVPGDHWTFLEGHNAQEVANHLTPYLSRSRSSRFGE